MVASKFEQEAYESRLWAIGYFCPPAGGDPDDLASYQPLCLKCSGDRYGVADDGLVDVPRASVGGPVHEATPISLFTGPSYEPNKTFEERERDWTTHLQEAKCDLCGTSLSLQPCPMLSHCDLRSLGWHTVGQHLAR